MRRAIRSSTPRPGRLPAAGQPINDIKFRGNYQRAVRAPNIGELFSPVSTGLTNLGTDPCAGAAPVTNASLRAVCIAQGAPAATIGTINNPTAGQANVTGGGNPFAQPEKAKSYTVGAVVRPSFFRSFSATIDYYNIKVTDAISSPTPADLIAACFGASPTNPPAGAAATSTRAPSSAATRLPGALDGDPAHDAAACSRRCRTSARSHRRFDVTANYRRTLGQPWSSRLA